jgi:hypothetical protein
LGHFCLFSFPITVVLFRIFFAILIGFRGLFFRFLFMGLKFLSVKEKNGEKVGVGWVVERVVV